MSERKFTPNRALRRVREEERQESRAEFAESLAALARKLGEAIAPSERYIARLEDGEVKFPSPPYRRVLTALCRRPITELGFTRRSDGEEVHALPQPAPGPDGALAPAGAGPEWPVWFASRTSQLVTLIDGWHDTTDQLGSLQATLHHEALMFDAVGADAQAGDDPAHALSRRQSLATLAALPLAISVLPEAPGSRRAAETFLARSAASLTACWHLMRGTDLRIVEQAISGYITGLHSLAGQRSAYQATAARLASQAHSILGIVAMHQAGPVARDIHCKQEVFYARIASDPDIHAASLLSLASNNLYADRPARFAAICETALGLEPDIAPLLASRTHVYLAVAHAQLGHKQQALDAMGRSEEAFPEDPEQDRSYVYAEFGPAQLALWHGLAHKELARLDSADRHGQRAADIFGDFERRSVTASARTTYEIINHQAATAVHLGDLDAFESYMRQAIAGVAALGSRQRQREALHAWKLAGQRWPGEPQINALAEGVRLVSDGAAARPVS